MLDRGFSLLRTSEDLGVLNVRDQLTPESEAAKQIGEIAKNYDRESQVRSFNYIYSGFNIQPSRPDAKAYPFAAFERLGEGCCSNGARQQRSQNKLSRDNIAVGLDSCVWIYHSFCLCNILIAFLSPLAYVSWVGKTKLSLACTNTI